MTDSISAFKARVTEADKKIIAVDFDGVIHKNSKGFHNGEIYDDLIDNTIEGLEFLSEKYDLVIYSCKANPSRPLVNGKTGKELILNWLIEKKIDHFFKKIYFEKPNAKYYIDDKGISFKSWNEIMKILS